MTDTDRSYISEWNDRLTVANHESGGSPYDDYVQWMRDHYNYTGLVCDSETFYKVLDKIQDGEEYGTYRVITTNGLVDEFDASEFDIKDYVEELFSYRDGLSWATDRVFLVHNNDEVSDIGMVHYMWGDRQCALGKDIVAHAQLQIEHVNIDGVPK